MTTTKAARDCVPLAPVLEGWLAATMFEPEAGRYPFPSLPNPDRRETSLGFTFNSARSKRMRRSSSPASGQRTDRRGCGRVVEHMRPTAPSTEFADWADVLISTPQALWTVTGGREARAITLPERRRPLGSRRRPGSSASGVAAWSQSVNGTFGTSRGWMALYVPANFSWGGLSSPVLCISRQ